jgi:hypothetical protein
LPLGAQAPQLHRGASRQEPPHRADGGHALPHIFTTSYLTHAAHRAISGKRERSMAIRGTSALAGRAIGLRLCPMARDLRFRLGGDAAAALDEQAQKVRESVHAALIGWARGGRRQRLHRQPARQCLHPVGHWFEMPNLLRNGVLARLLAARRSCAPCSCTTSTRSGATSIPLLLGWFRATGAA